MADNKKEDIEFVLNGMFASIEAGSRDIYNSIKSTSIIKNGIIAVDQNRPDEFHLMVGYQLDKVIDGLLSTEIPESREAQFLFKHSRFVENHFKELIVKFEGCGCCADKSRTIVRRLAKSLRTGDDIHFDYNQEVTYHLPQKIFNAHDKVMNFFIALQSLYYGKSDLFIEVIDEINKEMLEKS